MIQIQYPNTALPDLIAQLLPSFHEVGGSRAYHVSLEPLIFIFKRNTPQLAADGIKGIRIQLRDGSDDLDPFSCGGALHAPQLAARVRRHLFTMLQTLSYSRPDYNRTY